MVLAIVFEVSGPLAMFRRPYTTTSSVSFPIAPPTAIAGLIGAILGFDNGGGENACQADYWTHFKGTQIALEVMAPVSWYSGAINFWNVKDPQKSPHIQVKHQFLKNPCYRIHVNGPLETVLKQHLEEGTFHFTPCLGTAYAFAKIKYVGSYQKENLSKNGSPLNVSDLPISSVIPYFLKESSEQKIDINLQKLTSMFVERLPFHMDDQRTLLRTITVLYGKEPGAKIYLKNWDSLEVTSYEGLYISWFPSW